MSTRPRRASLQPGAELTFELRQSLGIADLDFAATMDRCRYVALKARLAALRQVAGGSANV